MLQLTINTINNSRQIIIGIMIPVRSATNLLLFLFVLSSSVLCSILGPNLNFQKNVLGQALKSQVKKEMRFPCIPIFKNL